VRQPKSEKDLALAQATALLSICLAGGASHREALKWVANRATGSQLEELALLAEAIDSGVSVEQACNLAEHATEHPRFRELVVKIGLSSRLGTRLGEQLSGFASTLCVDWISEMRSLSQRAETRMLLPQVTLTLPLTILFSLYPSLKMLSGSFI
jgi:Flp pilus assembly protein TadB